ncbi:MAG TPA: CHAT domain-containing protein, partial [Acidobacteriota bacterium]|nr:CHAT domain-containing protein [Acidobacteriota bacterium]
KSKIQSPVSPAGTRNPEPGTLAFADLGETEPIDRAVVTLRKVLSDKSKSLSSHVKPAAQALDQLVMKPVRALVGNTKHLLISPDGGLNLIPFAALMDEHGKFLVERYCLTYLTSGRDLLRLNVKLPSEEPPLVLANPDYAVGTGPVVAGQSLKPLLPLPATVKEGQEIQRLVGDARLVVKAEATEQAIKAVHRPALLHVATHGYFLTDTPRKTPLDPVRSLSNTPAINVEELRIENPLLRSWLFFAGANQGGNEDNDGIMTALEAAQLDLWGTKLVTLSACETGVGEAKTGDGVYGLRRALVLAGSEAQLMSLWSVSDQATRKLMVDYYTRLKAGEGRSEALRNVQLEMLKDPRRQHPFYWASFIQSGEWANPDGKR